MAPGGPIATRSSQTETAPRRESATAAIRLRNEKLRAPGDGRDPALSTMGSPSTATLRHVKDSLRVALHKSANIPAPPDEVWDLICDWAGMLRWWLTAEEGGLQGPALVTCELIGEHDSVPRTRRMTLGNGIVVDEQIFYQNDQTKRIYYRKSDDQNVTGYIACMFDVRNAAGRAPAAARFEAVYAAMFEGFRRYFTRTTAG
jgi:hypothetical protein